MGDAVVRPPGALSDKDKLSKVILPVIANKGALQSVNPSECLDKSIYHDIDELLKVRQEKDYLCAYIAYQANKQDGVGINPYSSEKEATDRYLCFKQSVQQVNEINAAGRSLTAEVNKFSDMNPYERNRYLGLGFRPKDEVESLPKNCETPVDDDAAGEGVGSSAGGAPAGGFGSSFGGPPAGGFGSSAGGPPGLGSGGPPRALGNAPPRGRALGSA